ncbi:hypothetical protein BDB00DRAFT_858550 [Zychaea mexicana]|uniref:uncharacterized protein n=1 Tax=Zychaea mexicana TaxID=64656 RepID=UPI0022FDB166|nr:uncharacterized protein BDB00DRAFT_858550 [Zychaea mexicana]KAI9479543.1 hypothetical protein BDB00DRAFT_858550 [Zychaea mexicana]
MHGEDGWSKVCIFGFSIMLRVLLKTSFLFLSSPFSTLLPPPTFNTFFDWQVSYPSSISNCLFIFASGTGASGLYLLDRSLQNCI